MASVFDVSATELIQEIAKDLEKNPNLKKPDWAKFVKTGSNRERAPIQKNWYHIRMAAILRKVYLRGPLGTERLRTCFGGTKNRGLKPNQFRKASGKIIRSCLQQLEKEGLIKKEKKGRVITSKGQKFLNQKASKLSKIVKEKKPETKTVIKDEKKTETKKVTEKPIEKKEKIEEKKLEVKVEKK